MKFLLFGAALLAASFAQAQTATAPDQSTQKPGLQPRIMIKAGFNRAGFGIQNGARLNERRSVMSWHAGIAVDLPLSGRLSIQPALLANAKGAKFVVGEPRSENYTDVRSQPLYVEVPVNAVFRHSLANGMEVFGGAGPYIACAVAGKVKTEGRELGASFSRDESIKFSQDAPSYIGIGNPYQTALKRLDYGFNLTAGVEIDRFILSLGYGHGLANIRPAAPNSSERYQNRVGSVSIGIVL